MSATAEMQMANFNTLALRFQDEAYTLAYYLLGSDMPATQATEAAFACLHPLPGLHRDQFRLEILRKVWANCRKAGRLSNARHLGDRLSASLQQLDFEERSAAVLVDVLDLSYDEAAQVMDSSRKLVSRLLAQARIGLSQAAAPVNLMAVP